jgi:geranylgeranyl diphosphate synthase type I
MVASSPLTDDLLGRQDVQNALSELRAAVLRLYPLATFETGLGGDPYGVWLRAYVDIDEPLEVADVVDEVESRIRANPDLPVFMFTSRRTVQPEGFGPRKPKLEGCVMPEALGRHRTTISGALHAATGFNWLPFYEMVEYHMGWMDAEGKIAQAEGKYVRPSLTLLCSEAVAGAHEPALPAACAIELAHNFSLVHDDVQDEDEERHHRPTVWKLWGKPQAINAGDLLFTLALESLQQLPAEAAQRSTRVLLQAIRRMVEGQYLDISYEERERVSIDEYMTMVARKTGAMIAASCRLGAICAGADDKTEAALDEWGAQVGLTFQIVDDVLGIWGDSSATGKSNVNDIARKKKSLPVVYAFAVADEKDLALLQATYRQAELSEDDIQAVIAVLDRVGARDYAFGLATQFYEKAVAVLASVELKEEGRRDLQAVADFVLNRAY